MRIFAHTHTYGHNAVSGADKYLQSILEFLARTDDVEIAIDDCIPYTLNDVNVISNRYMIAEHYEQADVIFTHLVFNSPSLEIARRFNKPVIQVAHNAENRTNEGYIIYNSESLKKSLNLSLPSIIVNPPTYLKDWVNEIDHYYQPYITLVNCCFNKGGEMLKALATWMPKYKFLGVHGAYGKQMRMPLSNLVYRSFGSRMNYDDTRILIVPSKKESWSLCAAEAMASGIPVICSDLPGLRENCGEAAIYCPENTGNYKIAIELLNNELQYRMRVARGIRATVTRQSYEQLENMYNFIREIVARSRIPDKLDTLKLEFYDQEKQEIKPEKEKREIKPKKEKKEHGRPNK